MLKSEWDSIWVNIVNIPLKKLTKAELWAIGAIIRQYLQILK